MSGGGYELVKDASRVIDLFGQFDLRHAELRGVRLAVGPGNVPELEVDLLIPAGAALPSGTATSGSDYRLTLRCADVSELSLADFGSENVVSDCAISDAGADEDGRPTVRVALTCAPGCDLDLRCREIVAAEVTPVR